MANLRQRKLQEQVSELFIKIKEFTDDGAYYVLTIFDKARPERLYYLQWTKCKSQFRELIEDLLEVWSEEYPEEGILHLAQDGKEFFPGTTKLSLRVHVPAVTPPSTRSHPSKR